MATRRNIVLCAEDTDAAAHACEWVLQSVHRDEDVLHLIYVVKSLMPPGEVFHSAPGTAYSYPAPGRHDEQQIIALAKAAIEKRYLPILKTKMAKYELHLFAERKDASPQVVGDIILKCAAGLDPSVVVLAAHNKPTENDKYEGSVGSVANYILKKCKLPMAIIRP